MLNDVSEILKAIKNLSEQDYNELIQKLSYSSKAVESFDSFISSKKTACCPKCHSNHVIKNGHKNGFQRLICKDCGKTFSTRNNSITFSSKKSIAVWKKYLECMLDGLTIRKSAEKCGITVSTAFIWRHKVLDVLQEMQSEVRLDGIVETDETFFALSFKGNHKSSRTFTMPRKAHKRGKQVHLRGLSREQVCVPCSVNGNGLSVARISNLGKVGTKDLEFAFRNQITEDSVVCCDGATAYKKYAQNHKLDLIQLKSGKSKIGNFHVQHINAYHSVLKTWIRRFNGVSTKYLNNYLVWHNFVNCAKEGYTEKKNILESFVFTVSKTVLCKNVPLRNPIPVRLNYVA